MPLGKKISALVCVKNSSETLSKCLASAVKNGIIELVVIDGNSVDNSLEIARQFTSQIHSDEGRGLGYARRLGVSKIKTEFLLILGPDDVLKDDALNEVLTVIERNPKIAGLLAHKRLSDVRNFWSRGQDGLYELNSSEELRVIGNPSLYRTKLLREFEYDDLYSANEDTDLCERWWNAGYEVGWGPKAFCVEEISEQNWKTVSTRYRWYGRGDFDFINQWMRRDKQVALRHLFHPLLNYMIRKPTKLLLRGQFSASMFSIIAGSQRYVGILQRLRGEK